MKTSAVVLAAGLVAGLAWAAPKTPAPKPASPAAGKPAAVAARKVVVTYFHGNVRCATCRRIEAWTEQAVLGSFLKDIQAKRVEWRVINVDETPNQHYLKDYRLYTKSVIVSDVVKGKEARWKNLDRIWNLVDDEAKFKEYIRAEVAAYLKAK
jgi:hypothetical protein